MLTPTLSLDSKQKEERGIDREKDNKRDKLLVNAFGHHGRKKGKTRDSWC